jgi:hypothetical protein
VLIFSQVGVGDTFRTLNSEVTGANNVGSLRNSAVRRASEPSQTEVTTSHVLRGSGVIVDGSRNHNECYDGLCPEFKDWRMIEAGCVCGSGKSMKQGISKPQPMWSAKDISKSSLVLACSLETQSLSLKGDVMLHGSHS